MNTNSEDKSSSLVLRVLNVLEVLTGFAATGASNKDLADALRTTPSHITRAVQCLIAKGWARKSEENGRFYPTAAFTRLSFRVQADFDRAQDRLADTRRAMTSEH
ncbi:IclR family transcriptional regulator [Comamonas resistens]|uniref:IclR family transcriptional regulator n=1 Tax=Comamonas resistens TaxID=3046670 RepID=UPI0039BD846F